MPPDKFSKIVPEPYLDDKVLSPIDRVSEVLFGVIMALTFTCTFKVARADEATVREMLFAALGCNVVWGLVDGVFFIIMGMTIKRRGLSILHYIKQNPDPGKAIKYISNELPPAVASVLTGEQLEHIRTELMKMPPLPKRVGIKIEDLKAAFGIFLLVFLSTIPIALPFLVFDNAQLALRISNLIAIVLMFICGARLGVYASRNPWTAGLLVSFVGIALVLLAIYLGG